MLLLRVLPFAIETSFKPYCIRIFIYSVIAVLAGFTGLYFAISHFLNATTLVSLGWLEFFIDTLAKFGTFWGAYLIFPVTVPLIALAFEESLIRNIEEDYYPNITPRKGSGLKIALHSLAFTAKALLINLMVLPLYIFPPLGLVVQYWVNSILLGKEFFLLIGLRIHEKESCMKNYEQHKRSGSAIGFLIVITSQIPLLNLAAPMIAIVLGTHFYHQSAIRDVC